MIRRRNAATFNRNSAASFLCAAAPIESGRRQQPHAQCGDRVSDYEAALACYRSPEYQDAVQYLRRGCDVDIFIIEGYDGPQP